MDRYFACDDEVLSPPDLQALQRRKLRAMLERVLASNAFYSRKLHGVRFDPLADPMSVLPLTTRRELEEDQRDHPPYGTNLTEPAGSYCRYHQTSGSLGRPVRWLDTAESWEWLKRCWRTIFAAAKVGPGDRLLFPFSFGPFIGFWAAFESAASMGLLSIPAGGMTTTSRLRLILDNDVTVVCCTPTYALRLAEVAAEEHLDLANSAVRALIVAGEPGGSIPATRRRIESAWGARVYDHTGMTEIGSLGFECHESPGGVHLIESECIAEVIDPRTLAGVEEGQPGELVLTNLGRTGSPLIRYRTGDQVVLTRKRCPCGRSFARMEGGILGRIDDLVIIRGNNVFPSALEAIVREIPDVAEFRVEAYDEGAFTQLRIEVEPFAAASGDVAASVAKAIQDRLNFRATVVAVPPGSLPRFEMKARRFVRRIATETNAHSLT